MISSLSDSDNQKHLKHLNHLAEIAKNQQKVFQVKIAAGIVYKGSMISVGSNSLKTDPFQSLFAQNPNAIYLHAETDAIKKALKYLGKNYSYQYSLKELSLENAILYVARITNNGPADWGLSKPCGGCQMAIAAFDIKEVYYTCDGIGNYEAL